MKIEKVTDRSHELVGELLSLWEASVRATHHFLAEENIFSLKPYVVQALAEVEVLMRAVAADGSPQGFIGLEQVKIEMLFIHPASMGKGLGKKFIERAVREYGVYLVDVNEQNIRGVGFYKHMGFNVIGRSAVDGGGKPFPLLHLSR